MKGKYCDRETFISSEETMIGFSGSILIGDSTILITEKRRVRVSLYRTTIALDEVLPSDVTLTV